MKNLLKVSLIIVTISLFATSCTTSKKQHCDAYGQITVAQDNSSNEAIISVNDKMKEDTKS